jgi:hypothetical protein
MTALGPIGERQASRATLLIWKRTNDDEQHYSWFDGEHLSQAKINVTISTTTNLESMNEFHSWSRPLGYFSKASRSSKAINICHLI